jgi:thiol-disulfide isomerase/thioredoxin
MGSKAGLVPTWPRQRGNTVEFVVTHTYVDDVVRVVAVDAEGREHIASAEPGGDGKGISQVKYQFGDIQLDDIEILKFQKRPYNESVQFDDIVLEPEFMKDVLPWTTVKELVRQPAPDLQQIKAWKNTEEPLSLTDLQGKVVLLDFWHHACGACVAGKPKLMELHERFAERGLVIIAIHADNVESIEGLDQKLARPLERLWGGGEIPFPVALDGGGQIEIPQRNARTWGATHAAYGISSWPTYVLVGRDGHVVGQVRFEALQEQIERLLD